MKEQRRLTQHKRFVPDGTHPNFASQKLLLCWRRYATEILGGNYDFKKCKIYWRRF